MPPPLKASKLISSLLVKPLELLCSPQPFPCLLLSQRPLLISSTHNAVGLKSSTPLVMEVMSLVLALGRVCKTLISSMIQPMPKTL